MAARGYFEAFNAIKAPIAKILTGGDPATLVRIEHDDWYAALFGPLYATKTELQYPAGTSLSLLDIRRTTDWSIARRRRSDESADRVQSPGDAFWLFLTSGRCTRLGCAVG